MYKVLPRWIVSSIVVGLVAVPTLRAQETVKPAETPSQAVEQFMRAAADSNLSRMGELFGTDKGSVSTTGNPKDWGKRAAIVQAALDGITVRTLAETSSREKNHSVVTTELARGACTVTLAVTTVKAKEGWLVREFDLTEAWDGVNRPCMAGNPRG